MLYEYYLGLFLSLMHKLQNEVWNDSEISLYQNKTGNQ